MSVRFLCLLAVVLLAAATPSMAEAPADVAAIAARIEQPALLRGRFEQDKQIAGFRKPLRSNGQFVLARGRGVIWQTERPFPSRLTMTTQRLRVTSGDSVREVDAATEPALRAIHDVLFDVLAGDLAGLKDAFTIEVLRADGPRWQLRLLPRPGAFAQVFSAIELEGDRHVERLVLAETNGDRSDIRFSDLALAPALSPEERVCLAD